MRSKNLTETELRQACRSELQKMFCRISAGESIPPPRPQVKKLYVPASNKRALAHIGQMKALLKANDTKHRGKVPL